MNKTTTSCVPTISVGKYLIVSGSALEIRTGVYMPVVMSVAYPRFLGRIFHTTVSERWNSFMENKNIIRAASNEYSVGIEIVGAIDKVESLSVEMCLQTLANEMLDYYMNEVFLNRKPGYIKKYRIED